MTNEWKVSFAQWYRMPPEERKHRTLMFLADREREREQMDEMDRDRWIKELEAERKRGE